VDIAAERWSTREAVVSLYQGHRITFSEARDKVSLITNKWGQIGAQMSLRCVMYIFVYISLGFLFIYCKYTFIIQY